MRIGVLGSSFGLAHCEALRQAGHPAEILWSRDLARAEAAARSKGVARWTNNLDDLAGLDVVTIATPPETHLDLIRRFPDAAIICEKPLHGSPGLCDPDDLKRARSPVFVHYSFPYLDSARAIEHLLRAGRIGRVTRVVADVRVWFGQPCPPREAYRSVLSHELAWFIHLFGALQHRHHAWGTTMSTAVFGNDAVEIELNCHQGERFGIIMDITMHGEAGTIRLTGGWYGEEQWRFAPLLINGRPHGDGERSDDGCIWLRSNCRFFVRMFDVLAGRLDRATARAEGLWDMADAERVEQALAPLLVEG